MSKGLIFEQENTNLFHTLTQIQRQLTEADINKKSEQSAFVSGRNYSDGIVQSTINRLQHTTQKSLRIMLNEPYFGRVDFHPSDRVETEKYYIGKFPLYDEHSNLLVIEWQSPVASMYFQYMESGRASYLCPDGPVLGDLLLRREFEISSGDLVRIADTTNGDIAAGESLSDSLLSRYLDRHATGQMSEIVRSIQSEQDSLIRSKAEVLVVQGPAGSGKTVIALHRAAFILYESRKKFSGRSIQITASNVLAFSPNKIFSSYISKVLPELGEEAMSQAILDESIQEDLRGRVSDARRHYRELNDKILPVTDETNIDELKPSIKFAPTTVQHDGVNLNKAIGERVTLFRRVRKVNNQGDKTLGYRYIGYRHLPNFPFPHDVSQRLLGNKIELPTRWESKNTFLEEVMNRDVSIQKQVRSKGIKFKNSLQILDAINQYINALSEDLAQSIGEVEFSGANSKVLNSVQAIINKEMLLAEYKRVSNQDPSLVGRLKKVKDFLRKQTDQSGKSRYVTPLMIQALESENDRIATLLLVWESRDPIDLYRSLWENMSVFKLQSSEFCNEAILNQIVEDTLDSLGRRPLHYEDLLPITLLDGSYRSFSTFGRISHAIVDEAQDYAPTYYSYIQKRVPDNCTFTIVGDIHQSLANGVGLDHYQQLEIVFGRRMHNMQLFHNYRSTYEILEFSRQMLPIPPLISSMRTSGKLPKVVTYRTVEDQNTKIIKILQHLQSEGYTTIAVLTRTQKEATNLSKNIPNNLKARLLNEDTDSLGTGIFLLPVYLAKGLEFDAVVIHDVSDTFYLNNDYNMLYTAATRALHDLYMLHNGQPSHLLPLKRIDLYEQH